MSTVTTTTPSRNPFRSNLPTPSATGTPSSVRTTEDPPSLTTTTSDSRVAQSPLPSFSAAVSSPPSITVSPVLPDETRRIPPERDLDGIPLEEPPPYTPSPAPNSGETTVEHGPGRPFQPPPPRGSTPHRNQPLVQNPVMHTGNSSTSLSSPSSPSNGRSGSLLRQLTNSLNQVVQSLNNPVVSPHWTEQGSSYPGLPRSQPHYPPPPHPPPPTGPPSINGSTSSRFEPPPRHPRSPSVSAAPSRRPLSPPTLSENMRRHSSEFARDFYAAGAEYVPEGAYDPPTRPPSPPPRPMATGTRRASISNDGRPTTTPSLGHPLLKDGKLLVFPKGYECDKCHNVGYKNADPLRPCKRCWSKYAKPFSGPLVYSFNNPSSSSSSAQPDGNFQRPLPRVPPPAPPPAPPALATSPPPPHFGQGGYMSNHHGGFYTPPTGIRASGAPPPGSVVYTAGDPRIGGRLCWRCDGKGNTSFMVFERITCAVCGGVGRTFA